MGIYLADTKTSDTRYLQVPAETLGLLREWKAEQEHMRLVSSNLWQETGFVFTRDDGREMNPDTLTPWLGSFSERHGLPHINPHAYRHTVASVLIANDTDVVTVSDYVAIATFSSPKA